MIHLSDANRRDVHHIDRHRRRRPTARLATVAAHRRLPLSRRHRLPPDRRSGGRCRVARGGGRGRLPVDYDHSIDLAAPKGLPAPAAGWIDQLEARADGIWGRVAWTARAAASIAALEYRHISPVFDHTRGGAVVRILRAALTNSPAIPNLTALAASAGAAVLAVAAPADPRAVALAARVRQAQRAAIGLPVTAAEAVRLELAAARPVADQRGVGDLNPAEVAAEARALVYELAELGIVIELPEAVLQIIGR
jgi:Mu-like prophage I protein